SPPRPIDGGRVAQAMVEYTGNRMGVVTYRGRSGREYHFDASPWDKRKYVLKEDLELFQNRPDFRVLEEGWIDPEAEERQRRETEFAELRAQLEEQRSRGVIAIREVARLLEAHGKRGRRLPTGKPSGHPAGRGFGAKLDCWMTCGRLEEYFATSEAAYEAIHRYLKGHAAPGEHIPPRERFASLRSHAKRKREKAGLECLWHN
ncbi:unnamed protein product, partial [marine sediment metagenome]